MATLFTASPATASSHVRHELRVTGAVLLEGFGSDQFRDLFDEIARRRHHRDGDSNATTLIAPRPVGSTPGYAGFSRSALAPHTDCSSWESPPTVLGLLCVKAAPVGGEALLVDGWAAINSLTTSEREALQSVAVEIGTDRRAMTILSPGTGGPSIRYRDDSLIFPDPLGPTWMRLRCALVDNLLTLPLNEYQGYLIDNTRWLHGRTAFRGQRLALRLLGDRRNSANETRLAS